MKAAKGSSCDSRFMEGKSIEDKANQLQQQSKLKFMESTATQSHKKINSNKSLTPSTLKQPIDRDNVSNSSSYLFKYKVLIRLALWQTDCSLLSKCSRLTYIYTYQLFYAIHARESNISFSITVLKSKAWRQEHAKHWLVCRKAAIFIYLQFFWNYLKVAVFVTA